MSRPTAAAAQQAAPPSDVAQGFIEITARVVGLNGQTSPMLGAAALLGFSGRWRAGGAGLFLLEHVELEIPPPLQDLELDMAYAGVVLERMSHPFASGGAAGELGWTVRLLIGAGNAEIRSSVTGSRLRADNFLVLEPTAAVVTPLAGRVSAGAVAGYRVAIGVDGLETISESQLRGWSIGGLLRLGPF